MRTRLRFVLAGAVLAAVILSLASAATRLSPVVRAAWHSVDSPAGSPTARDLAPANPWSLAPFIEAARTVIPEDATFAVAIGQDPPTDTLRAQALPWLLAYGLAPRRMTTDVSSADWVITYHRSSETLGVRIEREVGLTTDGNAVEVKR